MRMDLLRELIEETERASRVLGLEIRREIPSSVELVDPDSLGNCSSREGGGPYISAELGSRVSEVIRRRP